MILQKKLTLPHFQFVGDGSPVPHPMAQAIYCDAVTSRVGSVVSGICLVCTSSIQQQLNIRSWASLTRDVGKIGIIKQLARPTWRGHRLCFDVALFDVLHKIGRIKQLARPTWHGHRLCFDVALFDVLLVSVSRGTKLPGSGLLNFGSCVTWAISNLARLER